MADEFDMTRHGPALQLLTLLVVDEIQRARVAGSDLSIDDAALIVLRRYGLEPDGESPEAILRPVTRSEMSTT